MQSRDAPPRDSWLQCRLTLEGRVEHDPLFAIPLQAIDWAVDRGIADRYFCGLSLGHLVITNRRLQAKHADKLVVIPKPKAIELRLYHDTQLAELVETDQARMGEELDRLVGDFR